MSSDALDLLVHRLTGKPNDRFTWVLAPDDDAEAFTVTTAGDRITITGSTVSALTAGLGQYLMVVEHQSIARDRSRTLLSPRPPDHDPIAGSAFGPLRYCYNFVTYSYSMAFWTWEDWEREIDWLALHGINFPLSAVGNEAVWRDLLSELDLTDALDSFLAGPSFLPFGYMGCLDGWQGPLPATWIDNHAELQTRILDRQRRLGMVPILTGLTGHVPRRCRQTLPVPRLVHAGMVRLSANIRPDAGFRRFP